MLHRPPCCPEWNPTEHTWDEVREKCFANRLFATLDAVEVGLQTRLTLLASDPDRLRSLTLLAWVRGGFAYVGKRNGTRLWLYYA
jgi:hypothetical protein